MTYYDTKVIANIVLYVWFAVSIINVYLGIRDKNITATFGWASTCIAILVLLLQRMYV